MVRGLRLCFFTAAIPSPASPVRCKCTQSAAISRLDSVDIGVMGDDDDLMLARSSSRRSFSQSPGLALQALSVLHIKVVVVDAERKATPVPRHALLVSDNPASAPPRRIVTALDGTADVRLRPGNYTVESDRPVAFQGKAYQWTQMVDIVAGRDAVLELTADNAEVEPVTPRRRLPRRRWSRPLVPPAAMAGQRRRPLDADHPRVGIPDRREGADRDEPAGHRHRDVGGGAALAGRQGGGERPRGRSVRDVAVLWIDPTVARIGAARAAGMRASGEAAVVDGQELFTIGAPLREQKGMTSGTVSRVEPQCHRVRLQARVRQRGRPRLHRRRRRGRDHLGRGRRR